MENMGFYRVNQPDPMAVIAGTFCLMSCSMQSQSHAYVGKLIDNFNFLADCDVLDDRFRTICRRMACHWESAQMANRQQDDGDSPVCAQFSVGTTHSIRDVIELAADPAPDSLVQQTQMSGADALAYACGVLQRIANARTAPRAP
jgi:hypothetical protein